MRKILIKLAVSIPDSFFKQRRILSLLAVGIRVCTSTCVKEGPRVGAQDTFTALNLNGLELLSLGFSKDSRNHGSRGS